MFLASPQWQKTLVTSPSRSPLEISALPDASQQETPAQRDAAEAGAQAARLAAADGKTPEQQIEAAAVAAGRADSCQICTLFFLPLIELGWVGLHDDDCVYTMCIYCNDLFLNLISFVLVLLGCVSKATNGKMDAVGAEEASRKAATFLGLY